MTTDSIASIDYMCTRVGELAYTHAYTSTAAYNMYMYTHVYMYML